jgi:hypothetical protein
MFRKGKLSLQLKYGLIFAVAYIVLILVLFVAAFCERGRGEQNIPAWILLIIAIVVWAIFHLIGFGPVHGDSMIFVGLFLTGLLVFGIGCVIGHAISVIVRYKPRK